MGNRCPCVDKPEFDAGAVVSFEFLCIMTKDSATISDKKTSHIAADGCGCCVTHYVCAEAMGERRPSCVSANALPQARRDCRQVPCLPAAFGQAVISAADIWAAASFGKSAKRAASPGDQSKPRQRGKNCELDAILLFADGAMEKFIGFGIYKEESLLQCQFAPGTGGWGMLAS